MKNRTRGKRKVIRKVRKKRNNRIRRYLVLAAVIAAVLCLGVGLFFLIKPFFEERKQEKSEIEEVQEAEEPVEFLQIYSEDRPPGLDDVYEQCLVRALGVETYCWIIGDKNMKYVVIRGVYKEHEDWYVYYRGNEENKAIRYEPSFMGGE